MGRWFANWSAMTALKESGPIANWQNCIAGPPLYKLFPTLDEAADQTSGRLQGSVHYYSAQTPFQRLRASWAPMSAKNCRLSFRLWIQSASFGRSRPCRMRFGKRRWCQPRRAERSILSRNGARATVHGKRLRRPLGRTIPGNSGQFLIEDLARRAGETKVSWHRATPKTALLADPP